MEKQTSKKKQKLIDQFIKKPLKVNDYVHVKNKYLCSYSNKERLDLCKVVSINGKKIKVSIEDSIYEININDVHSTFTMYIGENPFDESFDSTRSVSFVLSSILSSLGIIDIERNDQYEINGIKVKKCNWNPYIYKNNKKFYYQRDFVWTLKDKQLLIESIYQKIDCGKILVRKRGWDELEAMKDEKEMAFNDIVDGKQRLHAIKCFINNEFKDMYGNYYNDLSNYAQIKFMEHQLFSYAEMPENTKDNDVIKQFLKLNFTGVPQSTEHIDYVKSLKL